MQAAFVAHDGFQCGCTPGQIMSAVGLIAEGEAGSDPERIREGMSGNLAAAQRMGTTQPPSMPRADGGQDRPA